MSNFGNIGDLRIDGVPVGRILEPEYTEQPKRTHTYGSIIVVVATNAPLLPHQMQRVCKRAALALGRSGSCAAHGSGEIIIGFSTANRIPRETKRMLARMRLLLDERIDPVYRAVIEATEEAILNALCMAEPMEGHSGHAAPAIPLARLRRIMAEAGRVG